MSKNSMWHRFLLRVRSWSAHYYNKHRYTELPNIVIQTKSRFETETKRKSSNIYGVYRSNGDRIVIKNTYNVVGANIEIIASALEYIIKLEKSSKLCAMSNSESETCYDNQRATRYSVGSNVIS